MSNFIKNPMSHPEWNPQMGDFINLRVCEEDRIHEKKVLKKKLFISGLISLHMIMVVLVFFLSA